jgi:hypothetical protein
MSMDKARAIEWIKSYMKDDIEHDYPEEYKAAFAALQAQPAEPLGEDELVAQVKAYCWDKWNHELSEYDVCAVLDALVNSKHLTLKGGANGEG